MQEPEDPIIGSGPFQVTSFSPDQVQLTRYATYVGRTAGRLQDLVYRRVADSASIEDAMTKGTVEVVWRGLDAAAVTRLSQQVEQSPDKQTVSGYAETVLAGKRVLQLRWSPTSADAPQQSAPGGHRPGPAGGSHLGLRGAQSMCPVTPRASLWAARSLPR